MWLLLRSKRPLLRTVEPPLTADGDATGAVSAEARVAAALQQAGARAGGDLAGRAAPAEGGSRDQRWWKHFARATRMGALRGLASAGG